MTHPITPPPELLKQWEDDWFNERENVDVLLIQAFQAGADHELDACCEELDNLNDGYWSEKLRAARRPKPPSLKQVALLAIDVAVADDRLSADVANVVRRALDEIDD